MHQMPTRAQLQTMQHEINLVMAELDKISARHGGHWVPTVVFRERATNKFSIVCSNDSLHDVAECCAEMGNDDAVTIDDIPVIESIRAIRG